MFILFCILLFFVSLWLNFVIGIKYEEFNTLSFITAILFFLSIIGFFGGPKEMLVGFIFFSGLCLSLLIINFIAFIINQISIKLTGKKCLFSYYELKNKKQ